MKLAEFILTKPEDRSKRKDNDNTASEEISGEKEDLEYEESEEELAMIMKKGILLIELKNEQISILSLISAYCKGFHYLCRRYGRKIHVDVR